MKAMTAVEAREWCSQDAVGLQVNRDGTISYRIHGEHKFFISAPTEHLDIVILTRAILLFHEEVSFSGGFIWLHRWDIGSPELVRVGWRILEDIRRAHGEPCNLETAPAQVFRGDELVELHAFLVQTVAFGWLSDFVPFAGRFFVHFKTDGQICFIAESAKTIDDLRKVFREWNPTDKDPMVEKMISMERARKRAGHRRKRTES